MAILKIKDEHGNFIGIPSIKGETLEDGTFIPPYLTEVIYLAKQIETLEQAQELYEEVK